MAAAAGPSTSSKATGGCKQCGGKLIEDYSGSMYMMLCESCGAVDNDEKLMSGDLEVEDNPDKRGHRPSFGALSQKVEGQCDWERRKETKFIHLIEQMASDTRLNGRELELCKEEGRNVLPRAKFQKTSIIAAALVFMALKRQSPSVTFKEVSRLTHIGQKPLGRAVKWLKKQPNVSLPNEGCTFEQRIQQLLDRLKIPNDLANQAKKVSLSLKQLCYGRSGQDSLNEYKSALGDATYVVVALNHLYRDKPPPDSWDIVLCGLMQYKMTGMRSRLHKFRTQLHSIAANIPSLESRIKTNVINKRNIDKYLHYILDNKDYLLSLSAPARPDNSSPQKTNDEGSNQSASDDDDATVADELVLPNEANPFPMTHPGTRRMHRRKARAIAAENGEIPECEEESDSFGEFDEKEIDQYIATAREVKKKKIYFKKQDIT